jgi:DNA-binding transcriptional MocR family regulator
MFIWLNLPEPWRVTDFAKAAEDRNTIVMESERFVIGRGAAPHAIRISLTSAQTRELLVEGLNIIADLVSSPSKFNPLV